MKRVLHVYAAGSANGPSPFRSDFVSWLNESWWVIVIGALSHPLLVTSIFYLRSRLLSGAQGKRLSMRPPALLFFPC